MLLRHGTQSYSGLAEQVLHLLFNPFQRGLDGEHLFLVLSGLQFMLLRWIIAIRWTCSTGADFHYLHHFIIFKGFRVGTVLFLVLSGLQTLLLTNTVDSLETGAEDFFYLKKLQ